MTRQDVLDWLNQHPEATDTDPEEALEEVELEVKRHAEELAWLAAKQMAEDKRRYWSHRTHAMHCPEHWAVKEFCYELAREMKHQEPKPAAGSEAEFASELCLHPFQPEASDCSSGFTTWRRAKSTGCGEKSSGISAHGPNAGSEMGCSLRRSGGSTPTATRKRPSARPNSWRASSTRGLTCTSEPRRSQKNVSPRPTAGRGRCRVSGPRIVGMVLSPPAPSGPGGFRGRARLRV